MTHTTIAVEEGNLYIGICVLINLQRGNKVLPLTILCKGARSQIFAKDSGGHDGMMLTNDPNSHVNSIGWALCGLHGRIEESVQRHFSISQPIEMRLRLSQLRLPNLISFWALKHRVRTIPETEDSLSWHFDFLLLIITTFCDLIDYTCLFRSPLNLPWTIYSNNRCI